MPCFLISYFQFCHFRSKFVVHLCIRMKHMVKCVCKCVSVYLIYKLSPSLLMLLLYTYLPLVSNCHVTYNISNNHIVLLTSELIKSLTPYGISIMGIIIISCMCGMYVQWNVFVMDGILLWMGRYSNVLVLKMSIEIIKKFLKIFQSFALTYFCT